MSLLELLVGQIPEALFFSLFMIYTKRLKEKRLLFIALMILDYVLLLKIIENALYFHVLFFITTYIILKSLYKMKSQIIDVFMLGIASLVVMDCCSLPLPLYLYGICNYYQYIIITRVLLGLFIIVFKNKLYKIQELYKSLWNRDDEVKKIMKSTTFRCFNLVVFNFMFYLLGISLQ